MWCCNCGAETPIIVHIERKLWCVPCLEKLIRTLKDEIERLRLQPHENCPIVQAVLREGGEVPSAMEVRKLREELRRARRELRRHRLRRRRKKPRRRVFR